MDPKTTRVVLLALMFLGMWMLALMWQAGNQAPTEMVPYSRFIQMVRNEEVLGVRMRGQIADILLAESTRLGEDRPLTMRARTVLPENGDPALLPLLEESGVAVSVEPKNEGAGWLLSFLPWILILGAYLWFQSRLYGNITGRFGDKWADSFKAKSDTKAEVSRPKITFADVAGQDSAKREVTELVDFLRNPDMYWALGAEAPKGVLLMGPPGTGKTLLAKALAGEAGVPFLSVSASEFIEMFVGVGAGRVRTLFEQARKQAPSIVFIDELDSVGRVRGAGLGGGHDEREQTLNQILSELDGFSGREAVLVLAATNRPDVLDPALLRPGRFDRHVMLELPDREARSAILKVHTRKVPLDEDVELDTIAAGTPGFSGADLKNLVNEAAMAAARDGAKKVAMRHLDDMRDKVMMGTVRTMAILPEERHRLAVHEAGHTAVAHFLPEADPLYKVTIIPRGRSLGSTHMLPEEERHTLPGAYLRDRLAVMLGGRAAERVFLDSVSSGADEDIKEATRLARAMVARWGMSDTIGPVDYRQSDDHPFLGREMATPRRFSEDSARLVDEAVRSLIADAVDRAEAVLREHDKNVRRLVATLETQETLDEAQIRACLDGDGGDVVPLRTEV